MNNLYGITSLDNNFLINTLQDNIQSFLDDGLIRIGGFVNVNIPTSGLYNNGFHELRPIIDQSYNTNTVWQAPKTNWVHESGISHNGYSPIVCSGIYVNNVFYPGPTGSGNITYKINYKDGQIIFNNKIYDGSTITTSYSYKWCSVLKSTDKKWAILQDLTYRPESVSKNNNILSEHNIQMPAIVIEPLPRNFDAQYELGSKVSFRSQDLALHIYSENVYDQNILLDICKLQKDNLLQLYNSQIVSQSGVYKLYHDGTLNLNGLDYQSIISNPDYFWHKTFIKNADIVDYQKNSDSSLLWCMLRITCETIF